MSPEDQIVVLGERRYRVDTPWGKLPAGMTFGLVSQLGVDSRGHVYVLQRADPPVLVFEPSGVLSAAWTHARIMDGHGLCVSPDDQVVVIDRDAHQILFFSPAGELLRTLGERNQPRFCEPFNHPTDVAFAADGEIYVTDGYGNSRVHRFSSDGALIASWGTPGRGPGQFSTPHAIWIDRQDRVLVADRENDRIQLFDRSGGFLDSWTDLYRPMDIFGDDAGMIYVTDQVPRLSMIAGNGGLVGRARPALNGAHGVWGDRAGNIFLAEMIPSRVTKLTLLP